MTNIARPKTLLEFAGAANTPLSIDRSAVVVIDAQEEYRSGRLPLFNLDSALTEVSALLGDARAANAPVIHIEQIGRPGGLFDPEGPTGKIMTEVAPLDGEPVIQKGLPNSFANTSLDETLKRLAPEQVIFVGFMTHMCVSASTRAALDLGYRSVVVSDAVATRDLPDPTDPDKTIPAYEIHRAALAALGDRFATIVRRDQIPVG